MTQIEMTADLQVATPQVRRTASDTRPDCVADALASLAGPDGRGGLGVLEQRVVPGRRASLDWLVVGSFGVFVVDEHGPEEEGTVPVRVRPSAGPHGPWTLVAGDQDHPRALSGAKTRGEAVREALEDAGVACPVLSVVVFDRASLPPMRRQLRLGQTVVVGLPGLSRLLRTSGTLTPEQVARVLEVLDAAFPPADLATSYPQSRSEAG